MSFIYNVTTGEKISLAAAANFVGLLTRLLERFCDCENNNISMRNLYWPLMMKLVQIIGPDGYNVTDKATDFLSAVMSIERAEFVALLQAAGADVCNNVFNVAYLLLEAYHVDDILLGSAFLSRCKAVLGELSLPAGRLPQVAAIMHYLNWQLRRAAAATSDAAAAEVILAKASAIEIAMIEFAASCQQLPGYGESRLAM